jgi:hypothetical protein
MHAPLVRPDVEARVIDAGFGRIVIIDPIVVESASVIHAKLPCLGAGARYLSLLHRAW